MDGREIELDWDEANVGHAARHGVLRGETEHVILNDPVDLGMEIVEGEERHVNLGVTVNGRHGVRTYQTAHSGLLPGKREVIDKMAKKQPKFETEAQETDWWAKNQDLILNRFEQARASGKLGKGTVARVAGERAKLAGASPTITIRLAEEDLVRARTLAAERGLRYQTYLKMLLHQALNSEERKTERQ